MRSLIDRYGWPPAEPTGEEDEYPPHLMSFMRNVSDVERLMEIHSEVTGPRVGRRHNVDVLNRSAIVLVVACWEAVVEDLASEAFDYLLVHATAPSAFSKKVLALAATRFLDEKDPSRLWSLAGDGWRGALEDHRTLVLDRYVGRLHTPKPKQVDELFLNLIGLTRISSAWEWQKSKPSGARSRLDRLATLRGAIAHRANVGPSVRKKQVVDAVGLVVRLAVASSRRVAEHIHIRGEMFPWATYEFRRQ